jgi:hypothetical protein
MDRWMGGRIHTFGHFGSGWERERDNLCGLTLNLKEVQSPLLR